MLSEFALGFSIWSFFGLTLFIDVATHVIIPFKRERVDPYKPLKSVSVIVPVHKEPGEYIDITVRSLFNEKYPLKNVVITGDDVSIEAKDAVLRLQKEYPKLMYYESSKRSKAKKINRVIKDLEDDLGEFIYIRDCRVEGDPKCIERMVSYFSYDNVAAVTSYGRVSMPKNFLSRSFFYGKAWVNEIGRFRKNAQEKRRAIFVICGASSMFRKSVIRNLPIPSTSKTEDTYYTWILQKKGYDIRVADDATVSAPEVDGEKWEGIKGQLKQMYRWSSGNAQCMFREGRTLFKNKRLAYTTIMPGVIETVMYTLAILLIPFLFFLSPNYALGFFIGDTFFSLLGTLIIIPDKFLKTIYHYPQIMFFKYLSAIIFMSSIMVVTYEAMTLQTEKWSNDWIPPRTK